MRKENFLCISGVAIFFLITSFATAEETLSISALPKEPAILKYVVSPHSAIYVTLKYAKQKKEWTQVEVFIQDDRVKDKIWIIGGAKASGASSSGINSPYKLEFPKPDQIIGLENLPQNVTLQKDQSLRHSLTHDGIFTFIQTKNGDPEITFSSIKNVLSGSLEKSGSLILPSIDPRYPVRDYSFQDVKTVANSPNAHWLVSVADRNPESNIFIPRGTVLTNIYSSFYSIDDKWHSFSHEGKDWQFRHVTESKDINLTFIDADGKAWAKVVGPMGSMAYHWPKLQNINPTAITSETHLPALNLSPNEGPALKALAEQPIGKPKIAYLDEDGKTFHQVQKSDAPPVDPSVSTTILKSMARFDPSKPKEFYKNLAEAEAKLNDEVIDQKKAVNAVMSLYEEIKIDPKRKHRVLLAAGPTGGGKTMLGLSFAEHILGDPAAAFEIDATQYGHRGGLSTYSLFGNPSGGDEEEKLGSFGKFLKARKDGTVVVVVNELDKGHPDFANQLMELFDKGEMSIGDGNKYRPKELIIILTTNKGANEIYPRGTENSLTDAQLQRKADSFDDEGVKSLFLKPDIEKGQNKTQSLVVPPEFVQRIDRAVAMIPPSQEGAFKILRKVANDTSKSILEGPLKTNIQIDDEAVRHIVKATYVPENGIRTPKKLIVSTLLAQAKNVHTRMNGQDSDAYQLKMARSDDLPYFELVNSRTSESLKTNAPKLPSYLENRLKHADVRKDLNTLESRLNDRVIGQKHAVKLAVRAIKQTEINAAEQKPGSLLALGPTGLGKSELAKAIAIERFGDPNRLKEFNFGEVNTLEDVKRLFLSGELEEFIVQNMREGGVISLDEIGNAGGGNPQVKNAILKYLYKMIDEGKFTNPKGETIPLSKFFFYLSTNDAGDLMNHVKTDEQQMATWRKVNRLEVLIPHLRSQGWPPELLARLDGNIAMFKPHLPNERVEIAKKFVKQFTDPLIKQHKIEEVTVDQRLYEIMKDSFFSHDEGARKLRAIKPILSDLASDALMELYTDAESMKKTKIHITLDDNYSDKHFYRSKSPPPRKMSLKLEVSTPGKPVLVYEADIAQSAASKELPHLSDLKVVAVHEAGHFIANDPNHTFMVPESLSIQGRGGSVSYESTPRKPLAHSPSDIIANIGQMLGGSVAETEVFGSHSKNTGWHKDWEVARRYALDAVTKWGLVDNPLSLPMTADGSIDIHSSRVQQEIEKLLYQGEAYARNRIRENRALLKTVAAQAMRKGALDRSQLEAFSKEVISRPVEETRSLAQASQSARPGRASCWIRNTKANLMKLIGRAKSK
jgi:ATP-dependent Clp protease ATP-binding subunit ClpA